MWLQKQGELNVIVERWKKPARKMSQWPKEESSDKGLEHEYGFMGKRKTRLRRHFVAESLEFYGGESEVNKE